MERLGDRLRRIEAAEAQGEAERKTTDRAKAEDADRQRHQALRDQLEDWKYIVVAAIGLGELPPPLRVVPPPPTDVRTTWPISAPESPDHNLYLEFVRWAAERGLEVRESGADSGYSTEWLVVRATS
jgi:hypothetical protein